MRRVAACLFVLAFALAVPVAAAASPDASGGANATASSGANATASSGANATASGGANFGAELSGFMASTTANTESDVNQGVWRAGVNASDASSARGALDHRARRLRERLHRLEARRAELTNRSGPTTIRDDVRLTATNARIRALAAAANDTASVAPGRETDTVTTLRREATNATHKTPGRGHAPPWAAFGSHADERPTGGNRTPVGAGTNATPGHAAGPPGTSGEQRLNGYAGSRPNDSHSAMTPSASNASRPITPANESNGPATAPVSGAHANASSLPGKSNASSPPGESNASGARPTSPHPNGTTGTGRGAHDHPIDGGARHRRYGPNTGV